MERITIIADYADINAEVMIALQKIGYRTTLRVHKDSREDKKHLTIMDRKGGEYDANSESKLVLADVEFAEQQFEILNKHIVVGRSEQLPFKFIEWYSGMEKQKIINAYKRWQREE